MKALIDFDILRYEIGHSGEYFEKNEEGEFVLDEDGNKNRIIREFDFVAELLDQKIFIIKEQTNADEVELYITNDSRTDKIYDRWCKTFGLLKEDFVPNFRDKIATVKPYKGTRKSEKPIHYDNLTAYMMANYPFVLANGVEADDLMAIEQTNNPDKTVICSRDKDLRQVSGWHYSWECGFQNEIGPIEFDRKGWIEDKGGKCFGGGEMFFLYQLLVGDPVDNIAGCPKVGHVKAMKILTEVKGRKDIYMAILEAYRGVYEENALTYLIENARLLWLLRSLDDVWEFPYEN